MDRDYVAEMRALIDAEADGEYVSSAVAWDIVGKLEANDPDLLTGWLRIQAPVLIREAINTRDRSRRTYARTERPRSVFRTAAAEAEQGRTERLTGLLASHWVVDANDLRKPLAHMNGADLSFVSASYQKRAADAALEGAFFAALARKVGTGKVSDFYTNEQLAAMRDSLRD